VHESRFNPHELDPEEWIGVDMGGSGARVRRVVAENGEVIPGEAHREIEWPKSDWRPRLLAEQLADPPDQREQAEARLRLDRLVEAIEEVSAGSTGPVAIAAAGRRTDGDRGLAIVRNGPRIPDLLDQLERRLSTSELFLCSDGLAGAWGEAVGRGGGLRGVKRGLYLGGGSGLAEALLIDGTPRELPKEWRKAWQPAEDGGPGFEDLLAPGYINQEWARRAGGDAAPLEVRAADGETGAREFLAEIRQRLLAHVELRQKEHAATFERVVVAQALSRILAGVELPRGITLSRLRSAPLIGAVAAALRGSHA
jgi:hypothetical protein